MIHVAHGQCEEGRTLQSPLRRKGGFLESPLHVVYARVLYLNRVSNNHTSALNIDMVMTTNQKTEIALVDSGATENFIDPCTVERLRLPI
jgi:hypothetical protein